MIDNLNNTFVPNQDTIGSVEAWRVSGKSKFEPTTVYKFPLYDMIWYGPDAEHKAKMFIEKSGHHFEYLELRHRTVVYPEWGIDRQIGVRKNDD